MKILFISGLYSPELLPEFVKNAKVGTLQSACDTFQWAVVEGLYKNHSDFYVLSFPWLPCYPINYRSISLSSGHIVYDNKIVGKSVRYTPLLLFKNYSIMSNLKNNVLGWIKSTVASGEKFAVLTYTPEPVFIQPLSDIKRKYPNMILSSIVTDLVDNIFNFSSNKSSLAKIIQSYMRIFGTKKGYKFIDKFILLTQPMEEKIPEAKGKNIVIEGIYNNSDYINIHTKMSQTILYTGVLEEYAGVRLLIEAFCKTLNPNYRLIICGSGPLSAYIQQKSEIDSRIIFRGVVSRVEAIQLQKSATLLINPRQPNGNITKYSFPSKTMEYMSSGTPMIGYKLEGMPIDYLSYMFVPKDLTIDALVDSLNYYLNYPQGDLHAFGEKAREYILNHKTAEIQVKKIIDFISN